MFESKSGIFLIAGLGFFGLAFLSNGVVPWLMYAHMPEKTVEQTIEEQIKAFETQLKPKRAQTVLSYFEDLSKRYPEAFKQHYGEPTVEKCAEALRLGRK